MQWLRSLRERTRVIAPLPIAAAHGQHVMRVRQEGLPDDIECSLLEWVDGRRYFRRRGPGAWVLHEVGRIMAAMHNHAENYAWPSPFPGPEWNWQRLFGQASAVLAAAERRLPAAADHRRIDRVQQRAKQVMEALGTGRAVFGPIHGDLIQANYLIHRGTVRVIDFAELGLGHYLYDIGITLYGLWGLDPDQSQRRAFVAGYRQVRELPARHEKLLDVFTTARAVAQARFVMTSDHPDDQRIAPRYLQQVLACLREWQR
jgi:Ser/Thr protein kinase RdoA (MazF antagonist)